MKLFIKEQYPCPICGDEVEHNTETFCLTGECVYFCETCDCNVEPEALFYVNRCPYCQMPTFQTISEHTKTCEVFKEHLASFDRGKK